MTILIDRLPVSECEQPQRKRTLTAECVEATLEDMKIEFRKPFLKAHGTPTSCVLQAELFRFFMARKPEQFNKVRLVSRRTR